MLFTSILTYGLIAVLTPSVDAQRGYSIGSGQGRQSASTKCYTTMGKTAPRGGVSTVYSTSTTSCKDTVTSTATVTSTTTLPRSTSTSTSTAITTSTVIGTTNTLTQTSTVTTTDTVSVTTTLTSTQIDTATSTTTSTSSVVASTLNGFLPIQSTYPGSYLQPVAKRRSLKNRSPATSPNKQPFDAQDFRQMKAPQKVSCTVVTSVCTTITSTTTSATTSTITPTPTTITTTTTATITTTTNPGATTTTTTTVATAITNTNTITTTLTSTTTTTTTTTVTSTSYAACATTNMANRDPNGTPFYTTTNQANIVVTGSQNTYDCCVDAITSGKGGLFVWYSNTCYNLNQDQCTPLDQTPNYPIQILAGADDFTAGNGYCGKGVPA